MPFKVPFRIGDYTHILPIPPTDEKEVLNHVQWGRRKYDECVWKKIIVNPSEINGEFRETEARRVLKEGVWVFIKDEIVWIPPNYYFALQYGRAGDIDMEFRVKRLKHVYFKIEARNNKHCMGTLTMKNRGDGETTMAITDAMWECLYGIMTVGQIGIQSKTRDDAQNPCWSYAQNLIQNLPLWFRNDFMPDFISKDKIQEKMQWQSEADDVRGLPGRNVLMKYYPAVSNAMDGKHNMKKCILDEICKWKEAEFAPTFTNYSKFIMPGLGRRGMFDMFSSPADFVCESNEQVHKLWEKSDTDEITESGSTLSGIHRHFSNPLEGIHDAYDRWGDADAEVILKEIMRRRNSANAEDHLAEVRGFPLNKSEMFESAEDGQVWDNMEGIKSRSVFLSTTRFKNEITQEPKGTYGNLEWEKGREDTEVIFRASDKQKFDVNSSRFFVAYQPINRPELQDVFSPPKIITNVLGIDPYNNRHPKGKQPSRGAAINYRFADLNDMLVDVPTMAYLARPHNEKIFYEDMIMAAVFNRAMIQYENNTPGIGEYIEDRGYHKWLLASIGERQGSMITGDAPRGGSKSTFMDKMLLLINSFTNRPHSPGQPCLLDNVWITELIEDMIDFDPNDTHESDLLMSFGQALVGASKLLRRKKTHINNDVIGEVMSQLFS